MGIGMGMGMGMIENKKRTHREVEYENAEEVAQEENEGQEMVSSGVQDNIEKIVRGITSFKRVL